MSRNEIFDKLKDILLSCDPRYGAIINTCTENTRIREDLALPSIGMLYIIVAMEETFGSMFSGITVNQFSTIGEIISYIQEHGA